MSKDKKHKNTAKSSKKGNSKTASLNESARLLYNKKRKNNLSADEYVKGILAGNRVLLSRAITLIESTNADHQVLIRQIIDQCMPHSGQSIRIGVSGAPGVGKSTFIESFGLFGIEKLDKKIAVLAVDPSSQVSRGSILGDKTRMEKLSNQADAFIRPSAAGTSLGGVTKNTRETIILCEAAGYDTIIIETVGVGQSEISVHSMVDCFLLLLLPGAGDELQGIKRGIVEMADIAIVNKSDGDNLKKAKNTKRSYKNALHLYPPKESEWTPPVLNCSALHQEGIKEIWQAIQSYFEIIQKNGFFKSNRQLQSKHWLYEHIRNRLEYRFLNNEKIKEAIENIEKSILEGKISPFSGAERLLKLFEF